MARTLRRMRATWIVALLAVALASASLQAARATPPESELDSARDRLVKLQARLAELVDEHSSLSERMTSISSASVQLEREARAVARRILRREKSAARIATELYKGGATSGLQPLLTSSSITDLEARLTYLGTSREKHRRTFERLAADRATLDEKVAELDRSYRQTAEVEARIAQTRSQIAAEVAGQQSRVEALVKELEEQRRRERLAQLQRDRLEALRLEVLRRERLEQLREAEELQSAAQAAERAAERATEVIRRPALSTRSASVPSRRYSVNWDRIAMCESGGRWHINSRYDGGLQFLPSTWIAYGGGQYAAYAWQATREQQIAIAERVLRGQGPGAWPVCFRYG